MLDVRCTEIAVEQGTEVLQLFQKLGIDWLLKADANKLGSHDRHCAKSSTMHCELWRRRQTREKTCEKIFFNQLLLTGILCNEEKSADSSACGGGLGPSTFKLRLGGLGNERETPRLS